MNTQTFNDDRLLTVKEGAHVLGINQNTFWRDVKDGKLPRPYYVTPRAPRWRLSELLASISQLPRAPLKATNCAGREGHRHRMGAA